MLAKKTVLLIAGAVLIVCALALAVSPHGKRYLHLDTVKNCRIKSNG
jgi:hypothetical protein